MDDRENVRMGKVTTRGTGQEEGRSRKLLGLGLSVEHQNMGQAR
jgi:hypothetical protein